MQNRKRDTDVQKRILDSVGEGEGGMLQKNSIETCLLSRVKHGPQVFRFTTSINLNRTR